jgi:hypothetical protein
MPIEFLSQKENEELLLRNEGPKARIPFQAFFLEISTVCSVYLKNL